MVVDLRTDTLKLIDFGMARMEADATMTVDYIGTHYYNAPELAFESRYGNKSRNLTEL